MRRLFVMASLVLLAACGGAPTEQDSAEQPVPEQAAPTESTPADEVDAASISPGPGSCGLLPPRECYCAQFKTAATCNASRSCVWTYGCQPTYES